ncbi:glycosyltransferase family 39 protein [Aeromicrobium duanguangcaii]|uniref:glycosyltransferase family 39 protein n=1 Tax=Aeromicrobium duanguangcaii TaxID=2968086 RepID=UPI002017D6B6|nr:glycosyltransferase family 39 protein [Aeromicrobium duanguangcaii]MCL3837118.1 glycosyltransferase family 39 protein [Aeromicrobium duanguangcaii]
MGTQRTVLLAVVAAVALRLPFLGVLPSPDEAGLLMIGGQWGVGDSLYGDYWIDRPPILLTWAWLAANTGGVVALRLLGLIPVIVTIVVCSAAAGRIAGARAARWAAVAAAVLTVSPWLGADRVNAELFAAPWLALGVYAAIRAVQTPTARWGLATGAAIAGAVLTKQNHADAAVFAVVLLIGCLVTCRLQPAAAARLAAGALGGAALVSLVVVLAAWTRGTAPGELFDALFSFRLRAAEVLASDPEGARVGRRNGVLRRWAISGHMLLVLVVLCAPLLRRFRSPESWALSAMAAFGCFSVIAGGSWWNHYLVELAVPVAVGIGVIAARSRIVAPATIGYSVVTGVVGTVLILPAVGSVDGPVAVGRAIAAVAEPGDTIVNAWGRVDLVYATGLDSPYEHLWSLPVRTDDPRLEMFGELVAGPAAPTWLVIRRQLEGWGMDAEAAQAVVDRRYRQVATLCGYRVYLLQGVERRTPEPPSDVQCKRSTRLL